MSLDAPVSSTGQAHQVRYGGQIEFLKMKKSNFIPGVILMAIGIAIVVKSYMLRIGSFSSPGPGFFPLMIGVALCVLTLPLLITSIVKAKGNHGKEEIILTKDHVKKLSPIVIVLFLYAFFLEKAGYLLTTSIIFFTLLMLLGVKFKYTLMVLFLLVSFSYLLFAIVFEIPLPQGFLRIR